MRSVSTLVLRGGVLFTLLIFLVVAPAAYSEELYPDQVLEARIRPPGGFAAQEESPSLATLMWEWLKARIAPPGGLL